MAIMIMERLATKVAIEANAAMSRSRSVIVVSRVLLCFYFVLILFGSQQQNKPEQNKTRYPRYPGKQWING
jgi:hypothetical protein